MNGTSTRSFVCYSRAFTMEFYDAFCWLNNLMKLFRKIFPFWRWYKWMDGWMGGWNWEISFLLAIIIKSINKWEKETDLKFRYLKLWMKETNWELEMCHSAVCMLLRQRIDLAREEIIHRVSWHHGTERASFSTCAWSTNQMIKESLKIELPAFQILVRKEKEAEQ